MPLIAVARRGGLWYPRPMRALAFALLFLATLAVVAAAADEPSGIYNGEYTGASGGGGKIHIEIQKAADGEWKCSVSFTIQEQDVSTKMKTVKVQGIKVELRYEFELQGYRLESVLNGELKGRVLEGKYQTTAADGTPVSEGTWKATSGA